MFISKVEWAPGASVQCGHPGVSTEAHPLDSAFPHRCFLGAWQREVACGLVTASSQ